MGTSLTNTTNDLHLSNAEPFDFISLSLSTARVKACAGIWALFASRILGSPPLSQTMALHLSVTLLLLNSKGQSYSGVSPGPLFNSFLSLHARFPGHPKGLRVSTKQCWTQSSKASLIAQLGENTTCSAGDPSSIPGSGRSPGEGIGYPLQCSGLENPMNCTAHGGAESQTRLSGFYFRFQALCPLCLPVFWLEPERK